MAAPASGVIGVPSVCPIPVGGTGVTYSTQNYPVAEVASSAAPFGFFSMYLGRWQDTTDKWIHNVRVFATGGHFDMQDAYNLADPTLQLVYGITTNHDLQNAVETPVDFSQPTVPLSILQDYGNQIVHRSHPTAVTIIPKIGIQVMTTMIFTASK